MLRHMGVLKYKVEVVLRLVGASAEADYSLSWLRQRGEVLRRFQTRSILIHKQAALIARSALSDVQVLRHDYHVVHHRTTIAD